GRAILRSQASGSRGGGNVRNRSWSAPLSEECSWGQVFNLPGFCRQVENLPPRTWGRLVVQDELARVDQGPERIHKTRFAILTFLQMVERRLLLFVDGQARERGQKQFLDHVLVRPRLREQLLQPPIRDLLEHIGIAQ